MTARPRLSVVLATCNRGDAVARAIHSILAIDDDFELVIVDQSDHPTLPYDIARAAIPVLHHRMARRGLAAARNVGISLCRGELIAMTDDDCEVPRDWLRTMREAFERHAQVGMVFGNVESHACDESRGFIPAYRRAAPFLGRSARHKNRIEGMGACMALRRDLWVRLGGFDEALGVSRAFPAAEEGDFALRALRRGFPVFETPQVIVTHHGFRTWDEGRRLVPSYWYGTGAMFAKHVKLAPLSTLWLLAGLGGRMLLGGASLTAKSMGRVASRGAKLQAFARGFLAGLRCKVNRATERFDG